MLKPYSYPFKGMIQRSSEDTTTQILSLRTSIGTLAGHCIFYTNMHRVGTYTRSLKCWLQRL